MSDLNMNKVVGETFEDMSISQMMLVQGSGESHGAEPYATITPLTPSSKPCISLVTGATGAISGAINSLFKC